MSGRRIKGFVFDPAVTAAQDEPEAIMSQTRATSDLAGAVRIGSVVYEFAV